MVRQRCDATLRGMRLIVPSVPSHLAGASRGVRSWGRQPSAPARAAAASTAAAAWDGKAAVAFCVCCCGALPAVAPQWQWQ